MEKFEEDTTRGSFRSGNTEDTAAIEYCDKPIRRLKRPVAVRVSPGGYIVAIFFALLLSAFLLYLQSYWIASATTLAALVLFPLLWFFDRISFDGRRIRRTGLLAGIWSLFNGFSYSIKVSDIEQVDTQAVRTFKRSGNVVYRYRTTFRGSPAAFTITSGGSYRLFVTTLLPLLADDMLDNRSMELRNYFADPDDVRLRANLSQIPSAEVLEGALHDLKVKRSSSVSREKTSITEDRSKAESLRKLGNELRLSGALLRSAEAFRRALIYSPNDSRLLFEFAHCLQSLAGAERDSRIERRAKAMLRLAEKRASNDEALLGRIGEFYFQMGDWDRAAMVFRRAASAVGKNFRAFRGLAELALREGKIAHVIHNFSSANEFADSTALKRWTKEEVEYFSRLNSDEEYMELEISRVNLLDTLLNNRRTSMRICLLGIPVILLGFLIGDSLLTNIGWGISLAASIFWIVINLIRRTLDARIPFDLVDNDN